MVSDIEDKKARSLAYVDKFGKGSASIMSGIGRAGLVKAALSQEDEKARLDRIRSMSAGVPSPAVHVETEKPEVVAADAADTGNPVETVPPTIPADPVEVVGGSGVAEPIPHTDRNIRNREVPMTEHDSVLTFVMGGNTIEIENDATTIAVDAFSMMLDACMADPFDEIVIGLGHDRARAAKLVMDAGRELLEEMLSRRPVSITYEKLKFRPKTSDAAGRFLQSCAARVQGAVS